MDGDNLCVQQQRVLMSSAELALLIKKFQNFRFRNELRKKYTEDELYQHRNELYSGEDTFSPEERETKKRLIERFDQVLATLKKNTDEVGIIVRAGLSKLTPKDALILYTFEREKRYFQNQVEYLLMSDHLEKYKYYRDNETKSYIKIKNDDISVPKGIGEIFSTAVLRSLPVMMRCASGKDIFRLLSTSLRITNQFIEYLSNPILKEGIYLYLQLYCDHIVPELTFRVFVKENQITGITTKHFVYSEILNDSTRKDFIKELIVTHCYNKLIPTLSSSPFYPSFPTTFCYDIALECSAYSPWKKLDYLKFVNFDKWEFNILVFNIFDNINFEQYLLDRRYEDNNINQQQTPSLITQNEVRKSLEVNHLINITNNNNDNNNNNNADNSNIKFATPLYEPNEDNWGKIIEKYYPEFKSVLNSSVSIVNDNNGVPKIQWNTPGFGHEIQPLESNYCVII